MVGVASAAKLAGRRPAPLKRLGDSRFGSAGLRPAVFFLCIAAALGANPPQRIVSTAPSITEMLYALGLGDRVAGVTNYCRYPPEARLKPKIGDYTSPNLEAIAALRPDLVIIQTNPVRLAERLTALHLKTLEINQDDIAALYNSIRVVGGATGAAAEAARLTDSIRGKLEKIRNRTAGLPRTRVMFVVGRTPGRLNGLVVAGKASYLNEIIQTAGGENVFRDAPGGYPNVSLEEVLARNPEVIVDMGDMSDTGNVSDDHKREVVGLWQSLPSLAAVKQRRVFPVASDIFVVPGPRVVDAAQAFLDMLHPSSGSLK
jgi:iron complex transport system substrate-binding protein